MPPVDLPVEAAGLEPPLRGPVLIEALKRPECYPHPVDRIELIETHLSRVFLTGKYVYKIKKPLDLGFADFSTLERRRRFCEEELRLNRRHAPAIYLEVVAIRDTPTGPALHGDGPVVEYAVKMRQFPQEALASRMLAAGALTGDHLRSLAERVAAFHAQAAVAGASTPHGQPDSVLAAALENIRQMIGLHLSTGHQARLHDLWLWTEHHFAALRETFRTRKSGGFVRECHGDLHLDNVVLLDGTLAPFDGIEFNDTLRWIDIVCDAAFAVMDLVARGRPDLAWEFLDAWLEYTGDHAGLEMLRFYMVYRALVRAKVALLRDRSETGGFARYFDLARACVRPGTAAVFIMHGVSGSGKTTVAGALGQALGAIRIRSDVERKRLAGRSPLERTQSGIGAGLYAEDATRATYEKLRSLAAQIFRSGFPVIVDAAFSRRWQREMLRSAAEEAHVAFTIVSLRADERTLRERIRARHAAGADASEADLSVLKHQIERQEPLSAEEHLSTLTMDSALPPEGPRWAACVRDLASRSGLTAGDGLITHHEVLPS
jgi:aminoglycoside phosphotransferase family enzyme/predicted kinase